MLYPLSFRGDPVARCPPFLQRGHLPCEYEIMRPGSRFSSWKATPGSHRGIYPVFRDLSSKHQIHNQDPCHPRWSPSSGGGHLLPEVDFCLCLRLEQGAVLLVPEAVVIPVNVLVQLVPTLPHLPADGTIKLRWLCRGSLLTVRVH